MRTWKIAPHRLSCGAAHDCWIANGEPYLELELRTGCRLTRCASHAPEAVPAEINGQEVQASAMTSLRQLVTSTRRDPKMRQANDQDE